MYIWMQMHLNVYFQIWEHSDVAIVCVYSFQWRRWRQLTKQYSLN